MSAEVIISPDNDINDLGPVRKMSTSFLDDFRKCIAGFDTNENDFVPDTVEYRDKTSNGCVSITKNGKGASGRLESKLKDMAKDRVMLMGVTKKDSNESLVEVKRYNILDGTVTRHQEVRGLESQKTNCEDVHSNESNPNGDFLRSLLCGNNKGETGEGENGSQVFYPCKVCKNKFISKSSLRKHICATRVDENGVVEGVVKIEKQDGNDDVPDQMDVYYDEPKSHADAVHQYASAANDSQFSIPPPNAYIVDGQLHLLRANANHENDQIEDQGGIAVVDGILEPGERPFTCKVCNMNFKHSSHLMRHRATHTNERPYACNECPAAFRRKCHLKRHWQRIHSGEKPFKCGVCGKSFSDRDHQRQHETIHGPETYPCIACRYVYPTEMHLVKHLADNPDCRAIVSKGSADGAPRRKRRKDGNKLTSYKCGMCGESFKKLRQIQTHQRVRHHDAFEKKYKCNLCNKGFDLISDLTHHRNTHLTKEARANNGNPSTSSPDGTPQNKEKLMEMLQQLEKRIQQQQQQVKKIENQQEQIVQEGYPGMVSPRANHPLSFADMPIMSEREFSHVHYLLRKDSPSPPPPLYQQHKESMAAIWMKHPRLREYFAERNQKTPGLMPSPPNNDSFRDNAPNGKRDGEGEPHPLADNEEPTGKNCMVGLLPNNRHTCDQCGISFLLYSEFRIHRKRHERAQLAYSKSSKEDQSTGLSMLETNPNADRSLCRECCSENGDTNHRHCQMLKAEGNDANVDHNTEHSSNDSVVHPTCRHCDIIMVELTKEREVNAGLKAEINQLREALSQLIKRE
ncbi:uncharacterized protein LOC117124507 [Anneissia japonica]|uniref:uncharacterized protein LOC117124507 n=1 Tax=Anneissia japonica TaxID=1529436 RepID=UPI0014258767|nr:uncharacterized protein LOC117124507 [Anneissia japonica]